jgi:flagellar basal body-associated protein FliL
MKAFIQVLTLVSGALGFGVYGYFSVQSYHRLQAMPPLPKREVAAVHHVESSHGATAHSSKEAEVASDKLRSWVTLEDMHVNVFQGEEPHMLSFKLEIELFDEKSRHVMEDRQAVIKNVVIEAARDQTAESLRTVAGKLFFKETVASRVNSALKVPLIRDVHLASFALR